jgi:hypothetical protein
MGLRDVGASLPPGFRFYPSDEELVLHYLYKKITNEDVLKGTLEEIDLHTCEPWQLPGIYLSIYLSIGLDYNYHHFHLISLILTCFLISCLYF